MSEAKRKPDEAAFEEMLREAMARELESPRATKRSAVRLALISVIRSGILPPNARLPAETAMAEMLGVSLGTVQVALGQLRDTGILERRRGDGTRLIDGRTLSDSVWHFRFFDVETGHMFRPIDTVIEVMQTSEAGPWVEHLGEASDYTLIRRSIADGDGARIGAEMVLNTDVFSPGDIAASELKSTNVRMILEDRLGVKVTRLQHRVRAVGIDPRKAGLLGLPFNTRCLHLQARTWLGDTRPFYYQDIFAPADRLELSF